MKKGINKGIHRGVNMISCTYAYDFEFFRVYIEEAIDHAPEEHLKAVENINIYDECPVNFPISASGGYYAATSERGADLDIYLNQCLGHMLTPGTPLKSKFGRFLDALFIRSFGKLFITHTILHELGHHVYDISGKPDDKEAVVSHFRHRASFRPFLAESPLPSARTFVSIHNYEHLSVLVQGTSTP
jgi:hypothetical protein